MPKRCKSKVGCKGGLLFCHNWALDLRLSEVWDPHFSPRSYIRWGNLARLYWERERGPAITLCPDVRCAWSHNPADSARAFKVGGKKTFRMKCSTPCGWSFRCLSATQHLGSRQQFRFIPLVLIKGNMGLPDDPCETSALVSLRISLQPTNGSCHSQDSPAMHCFLATKLK